VYKEHALDIAILILIGMSSIKKIFGREALSF
jgi:hypothetical protein